MQSLASPGKPAASVAHEGGPPAGRPRLSPRTALALSVRGLSVLPAGGRSALFLWNSLSVSARWFKTCDGWKLLDGVGTGLPSTSWGILN